MDNNPLSRIQKELKVPKNQFNSFGDYKYRSCEDILESIKLILSDNESIILSDEIVAVNDRFYVKATATFSSGDFEKSCSAFAREPLEKKKMDPAQITGATSSYARKYALNGLFAIDDTKDADTTNKHDKAAEPVNSQSSITLPSLDGESFLSLQSELKNCASLEELRDKAWPLVQDCMSKHTLTKQQKSTLTKIKDQKKIELDNKELDGSA